jgi:hypothetical protein
MHIAPQYALRAARPAVLRLVIQPDLSGFREAHIGQPFYGWL